MNFGFGFVADKDVGRGWTPVLVVDYCSGVEATFVFGELTNLLGDSFVGVAGPSRDDP